MNFELFTIDEVFSFTMNAGLKIEPNWLVNRYVSVVDEARKHEFILFYLEAESTFAVPIRHLQPGAERYGEWHNIKQGLIERANQSFSLIPT